MARWKRGGVTILLLVLLASVLPVARPALAGQTTALATTLEPEGGFSVALEPRAASAAIGDPLQADLRLFADREVTFEVTLTTSGPITLDSPATLTVPAPSGAGESRATIGYTVNGPGAGEVRASVVAKDTAGATLASMFGLVAVLAQDGAVLQGASGLLNLQLERLARERTEKRLSDQDYQEVRDALLGDGASMQTARAQGPAAPAAVGITVAGRVVWTDIDGGPTHAVRRAPVEVFVDTIVGNIRVATVSTDDNGNYAAIVDGANLDIFVRVLASGPGFRVVTNAGDVQRIQSPTQNDVPGGTTLTIDMTANNTADNNTAFSVQSALVMINQYVERVRGSRFADVDAIFPRPGAGDGSFFSPSTGKLNIAQTDRFDWDTIMHEYGHYVQHELNTEDSPGGCHILGANLSEAGWETGIPNCTRSAVGKDGGVKLAWGEAWPTYNGTVAQQIMGAAALGIPNVGDTHYQDAEGSGIDYDLEGPGNPTSVGEDDEVAVQRALWDMFDAANDTGDTGLSLSDIDLWNQVDGADPRTFSAAYGAIIAGRTVRQVAQIGCALGAQAIAPAPFNPGDGSGASLAPPTFQWTQNGGGPTFRNNQFVVEFYDSTFTTLLLASADQSGNSFTPSAGQWNALVGAAGPSINWLVRGRQTSAPQTGPYAGCGRSVLTTTNLRTSTLCTPSDTVPLDQLFTCVVTVQNLGPSAARNVVLQQTVSTAVATGAYAVSGPTFTIVGSSGAPAPCATVVPQQQFSCAIGGLEAGGSALVTIGITSSARGDFTIQGRGVTSSGDTNAGDDQSADTVSVTPTSDFALTKSSDPATATVGSKVTYTLTVTNNGPNAASAAQVTDFLPGGVTLIGTSVPCAEAPAGTLSCVLSTLAMGESRSFQVDVIPNAALVPEAGGSVTITNNAGVSYPDGIDPNSANNGAQAATEVVNNRIARGVIALYTFEENGGATVHDVSGFAAPLDLAIADTAAVEWTPGGLDVIAPTLVASADPAAKVTTAVSDTGELTIEAWITPADPTPHGTERIVTISANATTRNVALLQQRDEDTNAPVYTGCLRTTETSEHCQRHLSTPGGHVSTALTHVVYTRDASGVARLYINGLSKANTTVAGTPTNWDATFRLALANELSADRPWQGEYQLVAIYNRALSGAETHENFLAQPDGDVEVAHSGIQAIYRFDEGGGDTAHDTSGIGAPLDLVISDTAAVAWDTDGLTLNTPTRLLSATPATKLSEAAQTTGELTIELWVTPSQVEVDRPAQIMAIGSDAFHRNVALAQGLWNADGRDRYTARLRTNQNLAGNPPLRTPAHSVALVRTQIVFTRDATGVARLYVDGVEQAQRVLKGQFSNWDASFPLVLGNDILNGDVPWLGTYHRLTIANRAFGQTEVQERFAAGP